MPRLLNQKSSKIGHFFFRDSRVVYLDGRIIHPVPILFCLQNTFLGGEVLSSEVSCGSSENTWCTSVVARVAYLTVKTFGVAFCVRHFPADFKGRV